MHSAEELMTALDMEVILQRVVKEHATASAVGGRALCRQAVFAGNMMIRRSRLRHMQAAIAFMRGRSLMQVENNTSTKSLHARPKPEEIAKYLTTHWRVKQEIQVGGTAGTYEYFLDMLTRWVQEPDYHPVHKHYFKRRIWKLPKPKKQTVILQDVAKIDEKVGISGGQSIA